MDKLHVEILEKGALMCFTHDLVFSGKTNVSEVIKLIAVVRGNEPFVTNISLLITDDKWKDANKQRELYDAIKAQFVDNLIALLDMNGNKL